VKGKVEMQLSKRNSSKKSRGQTLVEFALILPVLLMTMYGVMEFGRLLFIYVTTTSATREAARYAAAVGISDNGVPFYNDCAGIREAAKRIGVLAGIQDSDIIIKYDNGPGTTASGDVDECPAPGSGPRLGDRIVINVTGHFEPIIPIVVPISIQNIPSSTARTIIRNVIVGEDFVIVPPASSEPPLYSPYVFFSTTHSTAVEGDYATIGISTDIPVPFGNDPVVVTIDAVDIFEAKPGIDFEWDGPQTVTFSPGSAEGVNDGDDYKSISVFIKPDGLYEQYERAVFYIRSVSNNNIGYPRLHVVTILPSDLEEIPSVQFSQPSSFAGENVGFKKIPVILDGPSGAPAWVEFEILNSGTAIEGLDFTVSPSDQRLYFSVSNGTNSGNAEILIELVDNEDLTGPKTIDLMLKNPTYAVLGDPIYHTLTVIDDEECNITFTNPVFDNANYTFSVDLLNTGVNDHLDLIDLKFTPTTGQIPHLLSVNFGGVEVATGNQMSPVLIPSVSYPWINPEHLILPVSQKTLIFQFSNNRVVSSIDLTVGFEICPNINISRTN
jgi:hypothetical protein